MAQTIMKPVSPLFGTGAAAGAAAGAGAAAVAAAGAGAAAGGTANGATSGVATAAVVAAATGSVFAGASAKLGAETPNANRQATPASNFVIFLRINIPLRALRCRFHRYGFG